MVKLEGFQSIIREHVEIDNVTVGGPDVDCEELECRGQQTPGLVRSDKEFHPVYLFLIT